MKKLIITIIIILFYVYPANAQEEFKLDHSSIETICCSGSKTMKIIPYTLAIWTNSFIIAWAASNYSVWRYPYDVYLITILGVLVYFNIMCLMLFKYGD